MTESPSLAGITSATEPNNLLKDWAERGEMTRESVLKAANAAGGLCCHHHHHWRASPGCSIAQHVRLESQTKPAWCSLNLGRFQCSAPARRAALHLCTQWYPISGKCCWGNGYLWTGDGYQGSFMTILLLTGVQLESYSHFKSLESLILRCDSSVVGMQVNSSHNTKNISWKI